MRFAVAALVMVSSLASAACATYSDDLVRAQRAFEGSEDERALAIFRMLEPDMARLSDGERAHYAYLRGMTDFRMGYAAEARHWLSLAASMEQKLPGSLPPDWAKHLTDSLKELNESVYTAGIESLTNSGTPKGKSGEDDTSNDTPPASDNVPAKKAKPKPSDDN
jgi:hypothetical protein